MAASGAVLVVFEISWPQSFLRKQESRQGSIDAGFQLSLE